MRLGADRPPLANYAGWPHECGSQRGSQAVFWPGFVLDRMPGRMLLPVLKLFVS
jgi:hypothetical protein